jgi:hypothetical protein
VYSTCIFCHASLGNNEIIERFPVGRRLAFDASKGRLWVVCPTCSRWNLTPLEERWEAVEDCERRYRAAKSRVNTGEIGLCRLPEGVGLVRIGRPLFPEMAAWRYGTQLVRRWKQRVAVGAIGLPLSFAAFWVTKTLLPGADLLDVLATMIPSAAMSRFAFAEDPWRDLRRLRPFRLKLDHLGVPGVERVSWYNAVIVNGRSPNEPWLLSLRYLALDEELGKLDGCLEVSGPHAVRLAGQILAQINAGGGRGRLVERAVARIDSAGSPMALFRQVAAGSGRPDGGRLISKLQRDERLALEMAANDEIERRAMEGELRELEEQWRNAEEIANIVDSMFLPASVEAFLRRHRSSTG